MTTAHRPTFKPAIGGSEQGGNKMLTHTRAYSARDLPAYLELKVRKPGQGTQDEIAQIDFKQDLQKREVEGRRQKDLKALGVSDTSLAVAGNIS
jgi:protein CWC15